MRNDVACYFYINSHQAASEKALWMDFVVQ